jgi:hypothetical protein
MQLRDAKKHFWYYTIRDGLMLSSNPHLSDSIIYALFSRMDSPSRPAQLQMRGLALKNVSLTCYQVSTECLFCLGIWPQSSTSQVWAVTEGIGPEVKTLSQSSCNWSKIQTESESEMISQGPKQGFPGWDSEGSLHSSSKEALETFFTLHRNSHTNCL